MKHQYCYRTINLCEVITRYDDQLGYNYSFSFNFNKISENCCVDVSTLQKGFKHFQYQHLRTNYYFGFYNSHAYKHMFLDEREQKSDYMVYSTDITDTDLNGYGYIWNDDMVKRIRAKRPLYMVARILTLAQSDEKKVIDLIIRDTPLKKERISVITLNKK